MSQPIFFITNILEFQFPGISIFVAIDNVAVTLLERLNTSIVEALLMHYVAPSGVFPVIIAG